jgi:glycosyltransferase involved in cell wall biosynthesis
MIKLQLSIFFISLIQRFRKLICRRDRLSTRLGFLVDEFFHAECNGYGGYGATVKNISDLFNKEESIFNFDVLLTRPSINKHLCVAHYHNADVVFRPEHTRNYMLNFIKYSALVSSRHIEILLSIDWYHSYEYVANALPTVPLIIWIHDPRGLDEWQKLVSVPLELKVSGNYDRNQVHSIVQRKMSSVQNVLKNSRKTKRKIIFVTQAHSLIERAKKAYGINDLHPIFLPNPIQSVNINTIEYSAKPSVCLLGRLEPVKRPWIFFELARRFPEIDFLVAGISHFPELMNPIISKYSDIPNLKFLGMLMGDEKDQMLKSVWAIINTSIHEALPVSFLEAFSYGKPVISCQNPDDLSVKFGYYTGEINGEAVDQQSIEKFCGGISDLIMHPEQWRQKGKAAQEYVLRVHSLANFKTILRNIKENNFN